MPGRDGTGPVGMGSMTGRAAGYCTGSVLPGYAHPVPGRGVGTGFARSYGILGRARRCGRRGWRNMFYATGLPGYRRRGEFAARFGFSAPYQKADPTIEKQALKNQAEALRSELDFINRRLAEMESIVNGE